MKRVFLIVLDSVGAGALPDAECFGDAGANTILHIAGDPAFRADTMCSLGYGNIEGLEPLGNAEHPRAAYGRCMEQSNGKDTTVGHWEISGIVSKYPFPTYPDGFPETVLAPFREKTGRGVLCNLPYSGTEVIKDYGEEHMRSGDLIVYTSADSVFQIAAHTDIVPLDELYDCCRIARELLHDEINVGRVIARPFVGEPGSFTRTADRRDFSVEPTGRTMLDAVADAGLDTIAVGKITDIFAGRGITRSVLSHGNPECMAAADALADEDFHGLCFINYVDFDSLWGHRNDVSGYAAGFAAYDAWLALFLTKLREDDALIITADHGCDPGDISTDHTREYTPLLVYGKHIRPVPLGTRKTFSDIAATVCDWLGVPYTCGGESFASLVKEEE